MRLPSEVESFLGRSAPVAAGDGIVVAFSGGLDSTALLWALLEVSTRLDLRVSAFHVDHGFDANSGERAEAAASIAKRLGTGFGMVRLAGTELSRPGEGIEEAGRRLRYAALEEERRRSGARYVATAHHRDDQAETVALRLLLGSGLDGLAATLPVRGAVIRPFLGLTRRQIAEAFAAARVAVEPTFDPTNRHLDRLRNRLRLEVLPRLEESEPGISARLADLAERAGRARGRIETLLERALAPTRLASGGLAVDLQALRALPEPLLPSALALLHRRAGAPHPAGAAARAELARQLLGWAEGRRLGCDCGEGWRWEVRAGRLALLPPPGPGKEEEIGFTYTLQIPGEIEIPEISARVKVSPGAPRPSPPRGDGYRVELALPAREGDLLTLRSRLPGDRLRPLGAPGRRRLKEVLIDRRVPREERDRIPLLCWEDRIAWVPGITIEHAFRVEDGRAAWIAEITYT